MALTGDPLNIGISGLLTSQRGIAVTGHNIANVNTEGYSRQVLEQVARAPMAGANGFIGTGVEVQRVKRNYDEFLVGQLQLRTSSSSQLSIYHSYASRVDKLLSEDGTGLAPRLQGFFDAMQNLANEPASASVRQVVINEGEILTERFNVMGERFTDIRRQLNNQLRDMTGAVSDYATSIARLNRQIHDARVFSNQPPHDLIDQRDSLVRKVAEFTGVQTFEQDNGALNVYIGNGQPLVVGFDTYQLGVTSSVYDVADTEITSTLSGNTVVVSDLITGGSIGGLLDFRRDVLDPAVNSLGRIATALAVSFNEQHRLGYDMNGAVNQDFFVEPGAAVLPDNTNNTGAATVTASITDIGALSGADFLLTYDGANYTLRNLTKNTSETIPGAGPFPYAVAGQGFSINIAGAANAGDKFLIRPTRNGAREIGMAISTPDQVAAAMAVRTEADFGNVSDVRIGAGEVIDATDPNLTDAVRIVFSSKSPDQFDVIDVASGLPIASNVAYTSGANIEYNGWRVAISGQFEVGDSFLIEENTGATGDSRNALGLADLQNSLILNQGTSSYYDSYAGMVSSVASKTQQAQITSEAQAALLKQVADERDAVSGVNLDEEAANLMRYQQIYQASAQVISTANNMFQSLLDVLR